MHRDSNQRFSAEESKGGGGESELFRIVCQEPPVNLPFSANPFDTLLQVRESLNGQIEFDYEFLQETEEGEISDVMTEEEKELKLSVISTEKLVKIRKIQMPSLF